MPPDPITWTRLAGRLNSPQMYALTLLDAYGIQDTAELAPMLGRNIDGTRAVMVHLLSLELVERVSIGGPYACWQITERGMFVVAAYASAHAAVNP